MCRDAGFEEAKLVQLTPMPQKPGGGEEALMAALYTTFFQQLHYPVCPW
jgi:hypothetical protein